MNTVRRLALLGVLFSGGFAFQSLALEPPVTSSDAAVLDTHPAPAPFERTEQREPCNDYDPLRRPFFGDLHVHTALSFDASSQDARNAPADAYAFAQGGAMRIQPYDEAGIGQREISLDRPLDFAAVTDHSEFLGEISRCSSPDSEGYRHPVCLIHRRNSKMSQLAFGGLGLSLKRRWDICGGEDEDCVAAAASTWKRTRANAEEAYDRSADCRFTSFIGYEWTATVGRGRNLHHNVIFRNNRVPERAKSWIETPSQVQLWDYLEQECVQDVAGCDAVAIPHNSNLSGGLIFETARLESKDIPPEAVTKEEAERRAHWNPLIEVMQHKGASECDNRQAVWAGDEFCDFELLPYDTFGTKNTGEDGEGILYWSKKLFGGKEFSNVQPPGEKSYLRYALKKGLQQQDELGVNSFKYGLISSTDTHIAAPGLTMEKNHPGHGGAGMGSGEGVPTGLPDELEFNPGGLAVFYAEENSRDALFAAVRRREAYATSGTRPILRFFGGWDYPAALCESPHMIATGYAGGVPMGGDLLPVPTAGESKPRFVIAALADAGTRNYPGTPLQRIQVVKGWYENGELREQVVDVAGGENNASVDVDSCHPQGGGHTRLCSVWEDRAFNPQAGAFYYARVLENPSCRWSQQLCVDAGVRCDVPASIPQGLQSCCAVGHKKVVQERAWSSPIWYVPRSQGAERSFSNP
jgi:hypothetical protein